MNLFDSIILNIVLLKFPIVLFLYYMIYNKNIGKPEKELFLDFSLITSLYLIIKFGIPVIYDQLFIIINIPLIIAYLKKRDTSIVLLSLMIVANYNYNFNISLYILLTEYFMYFIIYKLLINRKNFIYIIISLKILSSIIILNKVGTFKNINEFVQTSLLLVTYAIIIGIIIISLFQKIELIVHYHLSLKELEQDKQIRSSLFRITHEIKNPIAVCKGYLDMFDVNNKTHHQKYIPILKEEIERTLILLQDFLSITKIQIDKNIIDINMTLEDVIDNFIPILRQNKIDYNIDILDETCNIMGDYNRLIQVFINIIKNAIESMDNVKNPKLIIQTRKDNNYIKIYIIDNGVGFTQDQLNKLGEPFYTTKKNGTGLGITLSQEIIKSHDATIEYFSEYNKGTTVLISLPIHKQKNRC